MKMYKVFVCCFLVLCVGFTASAYADSDVVKKSKKADITKVKKADRPAISASVRAQVQILKEQIAEVDSRGGDVSSLLNELRDLRGPRPDASGTAPLDEGGEDCATAHVIASLPFSDTGNNSGNTDDYDSDCGSDGGKDVVYTYTPTVTQTITILTCGSDYDTALDIYDHCPTEGSSTIDCSDDDCGSQSCVSGLSVSPGTTYYIILDAYSDSDEGDYVLYVVEGSECVGVVECDDPTPGGETTADATVISALPYNACGDNCDNSDDYDGGCAGSGGYDAVYEYSPATAISISVELCGSAFDTQLYILDSNEDVIVCNDDECYCGGGIEDDYASALYDVDLAGGQTYYIVVDGYDDSECGVYLLYVDGVEIIVADNASCDNPKALTIPGAVTANTDDGGFGTGEIYCGTEPEAQGLWYSVIGDGNMITATTCSPVTNYDTKINVYTGSCDDLVCEDGDDDDGCEVNDDMGVSRVAFCGEVGVEYLIFVNGYGGETGQFELLATSAPSIVCSGQCECPNQDNTFCYTDPISIPDTGGTDSLFVTIIQFFPHMIEEMRVCMDITHPFSRELDMWLISPAGTWVRLNFYNTYNAGANWTCTTWDDNATRIIWQSDAPHSHSIRPNEPLANLIGEQAQGDWQLCFLDAFVGNAGTLNWTCITFVTDEILPVELTSFDAIPGDGQVTLNWSTASETDNDHFDIVRNGTTVSRITASNSPTGSSYTWTDANLSNGREYSYNLISVDINGVSEIIATANATPRANAATISEYALHQNYPNPFNPETNIVFDIMDAGMVTLNIYNSLGQTVATLANSQMESGRHTISFNAADLPSGLYFYRLEAGDFSAVKKMVLMK